LRISIGNVFLLDPGVAGGWLPCSLAMEDGGLELTDSSGARRVIGWGSMGQVRWSEPLRSEDGSRTWMLQLVTSAGLVQLGIPESVVGQTDLSRMHQWIEWFRARAGSVAAPPSAGVQPAVGPSFGAQAAVGQAASGQAVGAQAAVGQAALGQPASGQVALGQPASGQVALGQPASGQVALGQPAAPTVAPSRGRRAGAKRAGAWARSVSGMNTWVAIGLALLAFVVLAGGSAGIWLASSGSGRSHRSATGPEHSVGKRVPGSPNQDGSKSLPGTKSSQARVLPKLTTGQIDSIISSVNITAEDLPGWRPCRTSCGSNKGSPAGSLGSSFPGKLASCMGVPAAKFEEVFEVSGNDWHTGESPTFTTGPSGTGLAQVQSAVGIATRSSTLSSGMSALGGSRLPGCLQQAFVQKLQSTMPSGWSVSAPFPATLVPASSVPGVKGFEVEMPISLSEQVGSNRETLMVEYVQIAYIAVGRVETSLYSVTPDVELPEFQSLVQELEQRSVAAWADLKSGHVPARAPNTSSLPAQNGGSVL